MVSAALEVYESEEQYVSGVNPHWVRLLKLLGYQLITFACIWVIVNTFVICISRFLGIVKAIRQWLRLLFKFFFIDSVQLLLGLNFQINPLFAKLC